MELTISGKVAQIQRFLELMNNSLPIKVFEDMTITKGGAMVSEESEESLEMKIEVRNYYMPSVKKVDLSGLIKTFAEEEEDLLEKMVKFEGLQSGGGNSQEETPLGNNDLFGI